MNDAIDVIFIGSGHNSLACAAHLAAKGWSVAIYEQADRPGGAIKCGEYTIPGFKHDWAAMNLSLFAGSSFFQKYGKELNRHGLAFLSASDCFASIFPDQTWLGVSTDGTKTYDKISSLSQKDAETWQELISDFPKQADMIFKLLSSPMNKRTLTSLTWKLFREKRVGGTLDFARFMLSTPRSWLETTFHSPKVRALLAAWGMHLDFAPDISGGALFPYLEGMANQSFGMVIGEGGADTVTKALISMIRKKGGSIKCGSKVVKILHEDGISQGIELEDGSKALARRATIANVAPRNFAKMCKVTGNIPFDKGMIEFKHAPGTMMIHLAMDSLPNWTAGKELKQFAYVHLAPSLDQMARTYSQAMAGLLPDEPVIVCGQPTAIDPSRAPANQHILWVQVRMVPSRIVGDARNEINLTKWAEVSELFAERVIDIIEKYAPGLRGKIIARRVVSPLELEADNPNLIGGDQICGSHHVTQHFMYRPLRGYADGRTPIKNLYLTGAAVWPGAGTGAGSGYLLGRKLAGK